MAEGFRMDATSQLKADAAAKWMQHKITGEITEVPFVGPAASKILAEQGIHTTYQLCGKFMSFKGTETTSQELMNLFYNWLKEIKINSGRAPITLAIAEKCDLAFPGIYNKFELENGVPVDQ